MHFGLSEEQSMLKDMLNGCLSDRLPLDTLNLALGKPCEPDLWQAIVELGVCGGLIPESHGGSGLGMLEAEVIAEAMGRYVAPLPYLGTAILAPLALQLAGTASQQDQFLGPIATGQHRYGVGLSEVSGHRESNSIRLRGDRLSGRFGFVIDTMDATHLLLNVNRHTLGLVEADAAGVTIERLKGVDRTRGLAMLTLDGARVELIGGSGGGAAVIDTLLAAGRLALAADSFGAAEAMLWRARDYAMERFQFERPIGSFQAVKHQLAEMVTQLEPCRSLLWYSAHAFSTQPEERISHACHSKALISEVGKFVARSAIEIHGGMGFTEGLGLHLWYKRIEANRQLLGGPETVRHAAAVAQGWVAPLKTMVSEA